MAKKQTRNTRTSFYIENESEQLKDDIKIIAKKVMGTPYCQWLRKEIIRLRDLHINDPRITKD